jgi:hypothetical protein
MTKRPFSTARFHWCRPAYSSGSATLSKCSKMMRPPRSVTNASLAHRFERVVALVERAHSSGQVESLPLEHLSEPLALALTRPDRRHDPASSRSSL